MRLSDVGDVVAACGWLFAPPGSTPLSWDPDAAADRLGALCDGERATAFVAHIGDALVGFCTVYLDLVSIRMGQRAWLNELAVDPAHRSRGIGHDLLVRARDWAGERGARYMMVDSSVKRVDAHRFYRRADPDFECFAFGWML